MKYEIPVMDIIYFEMTDVITTSPGPGEDPNSGGWA